MDEQKKQKVLLAVLGVLVLGAGTYFVAFRGSSGNERQAMRTGPVVRREREQAPEEKTTARTPRRTTKSRSEAPRPTFERRERQDGPREAAGRRRRGRGTQDRTKKKTIAPAA